MKSSTLLSQLRLNHISAVPITHKCFLFLTVNKNECGLWNAPVKNSPMLAATGGRRLSDEQDEGAMRTEWGYCFSFPLTISVYHAGAAGVEGRSALQVSLILPLPLLLVCRLVHGFDLVLQHGKATDWHSTRAERARHLHINKGGKEIVVYWLQTQCISCLCTGLNGSTWSTN